MGENMKKGFTLIELLGVFSITALILLITVPTVTNMLRKAKDNQYESFKNDIFLATEAYIGVNHADFYELKTEGGKAYISLRDLMASDYLKSTIVDPKTKKKIYNESNYTVIVTTNSKKTFDYELVTDTVYHPYVIGDQITYDPGDGIVRTWNVISNSDNTTLTVTMMLNENLGDTLSWCSSGSSNSCNADGALAQLTNRTSKWLSEVKNNMELISIDKISSLIANNNGAMPGWLLQNLSATAAPYGYWTSTKYTNTTSAYVVSTKDAFVNVNNSTTVGIRPVITITKYK